MSPRKPHQQCPLLAATASLLLAGCDEPNADLVWRDGPLLDTSPGGGICQGCVTDWRIVPPTVSTPHPVLQLCLDNRVMYTGKLAEKADDIRLNGLLSAQIKNWQILASAKDSTNLCGGGCSVIAVEGANLTRSRVSIALATSKPGASPILQYRTVDNDSSTDGAPTIELPQPNNEFTCKLIEGHSQDAFLKPSPDAPPVGDPFESSMAHITQPSPAGGVRSCTGFLVGPGHVLTADHCFNDSEVADVAVRLGGQSNSIGVLDVIPYDPDQDGLADRDLALLELDLTPSQLLKAASHPVLALADDEVPCSDPLYGYGYGVLDLNYRSVNEQYDWGYLKRFALNDDPYPGAPEGVLTTTRYLPSSFGPCHGDSGGPVIRSCDSKVIAVTFGRYYKSESSWSLETMSQSFGFSRGNLCGKEHAAAYVSTFIDAEIYEWVQEVLNPSNGAPMPQDPWPPPAPEPM